MSNKIKLHWELKPQLKEKKLYYGYRFTGIAAVSKEIRESISPTVVKALHHYVRALAEQEGGLHEEQHFINSLTGRVVIISDNYSDQDFIDEPELRKEDKCLIMFLEEWKSNVWEI